MSDIFMGEMSTSRQSLLGCKSFPHFRELNDTAWESALNLECELESRVPEETARQASHKQAGSSEETSSVPSKAGPGLRHLNNYKLAKTRLGIEYAPAFLDLHAALITHLGFKLQELHERVLKTEGIDSDLASPSSAANSDMYKEVQDNLHRYRK